LRNSSNPPAADGEVIITTRRRRRRWKEDMAEAATGGRLPVPVEDSLWVREDLLSPGEDKKGGLNLEPDSRTAVLFESRRSVSDTCDNAHDFDDGDLEDKKVIVADGKSEDSSCPVMEKLPTENGTGDGDIGDIFHLDLYPEPGPSRDFIREVGLVGVHRSTDLRMGKDIRYILTRLGYAESFMIEL